MVSNMFDKAIQFLKEHKEIALATSEGNLPKLLLRPVSDTTLVPAF